MSLIFEMINEQEWCGIKGVIKAIEIDDIDVVTITTDKGTWMFEPEGDCCASAYLHEVDTARIEAVDLIGQTVVKASVESADSIEEEGGVKDIHFYTLQGDKSCLTLTLYVEHNGYYGGWLRAIK